MEPSALGNRDLLCLNSLKRHIREKLNRKHLIQVPLGSLLSGKIRFFKVTAECFEIVNDLLLTEYVEPSKNILADPK